MSDDKSTSIVTCYDCDIYIDKRIFRKRKFNTIFKSYNVNIVFFTRNIFYLNSNF